MNQLAQDTFARGKGRVRSPISRRRTQRLARLGLICGGFAVAALGVLMLALKT